MVDNCQIVEEDSTGITVETDLIEHKKLLEDLTNKFFSKKLGNRKFEKKNWSWIYYWKCIFNNQNLLWF